MGRVTEEYDQGRLKEPALRRFRAHFSGSAPLTTFVEAVQTGFSEWASSWFQLYPKGGWVTESRVQRGLPL
jgi:hypothetical protein